MDKWYHKSHRRNLIDMHIPDWNEEFFSKIDPKKYVANLKRANVDTAYIYTTSCVGLCNFPTQVGKMHTGLRGRDFIKEITEECRKEGIRPILYINMWSKWAYDNNPDWRCITPDGRQSHEYMFGQPGRYGVLCPNSGYREYVLSLVKELLNKYETDGLWIDMILWRTMCTCGHCQRRFKGETGEDIPRIIDMGNPVFMKFLHKREEWISEFFEAIKNEVYKINPEASVICNSTYYPSVVMGMSLEYAKQTEFISGDANLGIERSFEAKLFNNITKNRPFEFLCSIMDPDLYEHSMMKTHDHLMQLMTSCIAHNGRNGFIDAIDPTGELNEKVYHHMRKVYDEIDRYTPFLETEFEPCADVAIYTNFSCYYSPKDDGTSLRDTLNETSEHMYSSMQAAERLVEQNITFDVVTPLNFDKLSNYKALLLCDLYVMTKKEEAIIREYVKGGGKIYVSGRCAIYDGEGGKDEKGRLSDLIGVELLGMTDERVTYIRPACDLILKDYSAKYPLSCWAKQALVHADSNAVVLGRLTLPYTDPDDKTKFASAISNPPGIETDYPSIVMSNFNRGSVIYSAAPIENCRGRDHSNLFATLLKTLIGEAPIIVSNAPHPVEIVVYRQNNSGNYIINLTNSTLPVLTLTDITVKFKISEEIKACYHAPTRACVDFVIDGEYIEFKISKLKVFEMIVIEVKSKKQYN